MDNSKVSNLIGFVGSILLIIAVFTPVINKPFEGDVSFISRWTVSGILVLALGFFSGVTTFFGKAKYLWLPATVTSIILFLKLYDFNHQRDELSFGNSFLKASFKSVYSMEWGWFLLFAAVAVLFISSALCYRKNK